MPARDPSRLGRFKLGYSRLGVHTPEWEDLINDVGRTVTWRVAKWTVTRDSVTGHREPDYDSITHDITAVLVKRGSTATANPFGVYAQLDATLVCLDNVQILDQIYDPQTHTYYVVNSTPLEHYDGEGHIAFRECQLRELSFYGKR